MSNEIVKYHNDFNTVVMRRWTSEEMNFFIAVLSKAKNHGSDLMHFKKEEMMGLVDYTNRHNLSYDKVMEQLVRHVTTVQYIVDNEREFSVYNLFQKFKYDKVTGILDVRLNVEYEYILNQLELHFTDYRLDEYVDLKSTYSKELYRHIKQYKKRGYIEYSVDEFRFILDIPKSYKAVNIQERILKPVQKELSKYFVGFKVTPIKKKTKGNPIIGYRFTWRPETTNTWIEGKVQVRHDQPKGTKKRKGMVKLGMPEYYNKPVEEVTEPASQESLDKVKDMLDRMNNAPADGQTTIEDFIEEEKK